MHIVPEAKLLGVIISYNLTFRSHITSVCSRASRCLGFVSRISVGLGPIYFIHLFKSLVLPILDYCSSVWSPHESKYVQRLEKVQKAATRIAYVRGGGKYDERPPYSERLKMYHLFPIAVRRKVSRIMFASRYFMQLFPPDINIPLITNPRKPTKLYQVSVKTSLYGNSLYVEAAKLWNALPDSLRYNVHAENFKFLVAQHLFCEWLGDFD